LGIVNWKDVATIVTVEAKRTRAVRRTILKFNRSPPFKLSGKPTWIIRKFKIFLMSKTLTLSKRRIDGLSVKSIEIDKLTARISKLKEEIDHLKKELKKTQNGVHRISCPYLEILIIQKDNE